MASLSSIGEAPWLAAVDAMRDEARAARTLEDAAQHCAQMLYEHFREDVVLARVYALIPYGQLEARVKAFVDQLVAGSSAVVPLDPSMPVLSLLGTYGVEDDHCDRTKSRGHMGIPLLSAGFVDQIPMLARLLKELGINLSWLDEAPNVRTRLLVGGFNGVFYVEDARSARDAKGRNIIPAADFIEAHDVKTVFGMGGFYPDGTLIVGIVFSRETISRRAAERSTSVISMLKSETFGLIRMRRFFR